MNSRPYRMRKRADQVEQTRKRITEAAVRLHTTVGPAGTTISAVAEEAGVTRVTVYRHFPDEEHLFAACSADWTERHPPPDPGAWRAVSPVEDRAAHALGELYDWYRRNGNDLFPIYRDVTAMPLPVQEGMRAAEARMADVLVEGSGLRGRARRQLRAAAGHLTSFWTWHSLEVRHGLGHDAAVQLAVRFFVCAARAGRAEAR